MITAPGEMLARSFNGRGVCFMIAVAYRTYENAEVFRAMCRTGGGEAMTRLWLLRHAKAGPWSADDFARPLAGRGRRNAPEMGRKLAEVGCAPKRILCSAGRRAVETMCGVLPALPADLTVDILPRLYTFSAAAVLQCLRELPQDTGDLMVVGHNPALQDLALYFAGSGEPEAFEVLHGKFPTCAVAELEFQASPYAGDWAEGSAHLRRVLTPRAPRSARNLHGAPVGADSAPR